MNGHGGDGVNQGVCVKAATAAGHEYAWNKGCLEGVFCM